MLLLCKVGITVVFVLSYLYDVDYCLENEVKVVYQDNQRGILILYYRKFKDWNFINTDTVPTYQKRDKNKEIITKQLFFNLILQ